MYIISACLLGQKCRYDGEHNRVNWVCDFAKNHRHIACCPEILGGLPCPRHPAEKKGFDVINVKGENVTKQFEDGANRSLQQALDMAKHYGEPLEGAILKARSPSCGVAYIYDGTFSQTIKNGNGVFAQLLKDMGIQIWTEEEHND